MSAAAVKEEAAGEILDATFAPVAAATRDHVKDAEALLASLQAAPVSAVAAHAVQDYQAQREAALKRVAQVEREGLMQELAAQKARREELLEAIRQGRHPRRAEAKAMYAEPSIDNPFDDDGKPSGDPSKIKRFVRTKDDDGKQTATYVQQAMGNGYTVVRNRQTGEPVANQLGLFMEISPEDLGRLKARAGRQTVSSNDFPGAGGKGNLQAQLDQINRSLKHGEISLDIGPEHNVRV